MTIHYNRKSEKTNRRKLRQKSTKAEEILWKYLRGRKLLGLKFRRQYSIDQFVVDFFCPELKVGIEVDGGVHNEKEVKVHDENREGFINSFGIKILRIKNETVIDEIDKTLNLIKDFIEHHNKVKSKNKL